MEDGKKKRELKKDKKQVAWNVFQIYVSKSKGNMKK